MSKEDSSGAIIYWPWPIVKPESDWDEFGIDLIRFMQDAHQQGFRPRSRDSLSLIEAGEEAGRAAALVFRGRRNGWEPWLVDAGKSIRLGPHYGLPLGANACVCVRPPFAGAAHLVSGWLRGQSVESLLADFEFVGGSPAGIALRIVPEWSRHSRTSSVNEA